MSLLQKIQYLKFKLHYSLRSFVENSVLGSNLRDTSKFSFQDRPIFKWVVPENVADSSIPLVYTNPRIEGLYIVKNALNKQDLVKIRRFIHSISVYPGTIPTNEGASDIWFEFDKGRFMLAILPENRFMSNLIDFEVFGNLHPSKWPNLQSVQSDEKLSHDAKEGARALKSLESSLLSLMPPLTTTREQTPSSYHYSQTHFSKCPKHVCDIPKKQQLIINEHLKCFLIQLQLMRGGVRIMPHIDADDPLCDVIATLSVSNIAEGYNDCVEYPYHDSNTWPQSSSLLRVGSEEFHINEGDIYILNGFARHHVKHEVFSTSMDRLTITMRYAASDN